MSKKVKNTVRVSVHNATEAQVDDDGAGVEVGGCEVGGAGVEAEGSVTRGTTPVSAISIQNLDESFRLRFKLPVS